MKTYITLDYELFFGESGSVEQSIVNPTERLLSILDKYNAKAVFFVDVGYLIRMNDLADNEPKLKEDEKKVKEQIKNLVNEGHDIQLHIHSHWEDAIYQDGCWRFPMKHYRLHSYSEQECQSIIKKYKSFLESIIGDEVFAFRAGGWCIQHFLKLKKAFIDTGIKIDSTVFKGGRNTHGVHYYNFKNAPDLPEWSFSDDPCKVDSGGEFKEIPISNYRVSPIFFWKLLYFKKFGGKKHRQLGDGHALSNGIFQKLRLLFKRTNTVVSIDGFKASYLGKAFKIYSNSNIEGNFVIIGHPKAFSNYSLDKLDSFLSKNQEIIEVKTFRS